MIGFLADENLNQSIVEGLYERVSDIDIVNVHEVGLSNAVDQSILEWCALNRRILITQDVRTMPGFAYDRVMKALPMAGVIVVRQTLPIGQMIDELVLIAQCSEGSDWSDRVVFLPL